jgi:hypothetical protein
MIEWFAWGLGFLAILLAILLGVVIALISEWDGEIKNDGRHQDADGKQAQTSKRDQACLEADPWR